MSTTDQEREAFEVELRKQCFKMPSPEAFDLAWCMWKQARTTPPAPQSTEAELRARIAELEAQVSDRDEAELHMTLRIVRLEAVCREAEGALKEADNLVTLTSVESALASLRREIGGGNADQA